MRITSHRSRSRSRAGTALAAALMVVIGISGLGMCVLELHTSITRSQIQSIDNKRAFYLAEAGLSEALFALQTGGDGAVATSAQPAAFGDGVFWVESECLDRHETQLTSVGLCGAGRSSLTLVVEKTNGSVASHGIFGTQGVQVQSGALIDGYDSRAGAYTPPGNPNVMSATDIPARVSSNGDIQVTGATRQPTVIRGDAIPGPSSSVITSPSASVLGSTAPAIDPTTLPTIDVPNLTSLGNLSLGGLIRGLLPPTIPSGDVRYDIVHVTRGGKLTVTGPKNFVASQLIVDNGGQVLFDTTNGPVNVFVTDYLATASGSQLNNTGTDPSKSALYVTASASVDRTGDGIADPPATIGSSGSFYGTIFAPFATLTIGSGFTLYGTIAAQSTVIGVGSKVHFDAGLIASGVSPVSAPKRVGWRTVPLPAIPLVSSRQNPLQTLRRLGVAPVVPSAAHEVLDFQIDYFGFDARRHIWVGKETRFNWALVNVAFKVLRLGDPGFLLGL